MRRVHLDRPFTAGLVTDIPAYKVGPRNSVFAQDLIAPEGIARSRRGWDYDGTTADEVVRHVGGRSRVRPTLALAGDALGRDEVLREG